MMRIRVGIELSIGIPTLRQFGLSGKEGRDKGFNKAEFAQAARDALQRYLVQLIRAVVSGGYSSPVDKLS